MVSLVNFKNVNEELQQQQPKQTTEDRCDRQQLSEMQQNNKVSDESNKSPASRTSSNSNKSTSVNIVQVATTNNCNNKPRKASSEALGSKLQLIIANPANKAAEQQLKQQQQHQHQQQQPNNQYTSFAVLQQPLQVHQKQAILAPPHKPVSIMFDEPPYLPGGIEAGANGGGSEDASLFGLPGEASNFVVTWRNLRFAIEPKWHQKLSTLGPVAAINNCLSQQQPGGVQSSPSSSCSKLVLDRLDGSFRSGELTAILGPSGAGKTTLLDCLTGHRKAGLSGSIKISPSSSTSLPSSLSRINLSNSKSVAHYNAHHHHNHYALNEYSANSGSTKAASEGSVQGNNNTNNSNDNNNNSNKNLNLIDNPKSNQIVHVPVAAACGAGRNNLKVSIIPQNDHLIGHLTVYETLNYASKMKNCFERQFNHKLNIQRVAQQLGLMSCLGTRINKLSGGQYKRVSIAQELLSSPDILILDEPTSGLDAMTCYQTVQVLRKLTDERQTNGLKQIAVILTIHQPNSDVFQQFNHVYVVAQGGKCIYEGPPANIESVINRIGIRLPSSHYNPATMIVEIAAGKFSQESIRKLNSIQKKQYDFIVPDEQNSTGDSAVDCPSSSSSSSSSTCSDDDSNKKSCGRVNRGFELGDDEFEGKENGGGGVGGNNNGNKEDDNNNDSNNNNLNACKDVVVVVTNSSGFSQADDTDSVSKIKSMLGAAENCAGLDNEVRRKKRRRTRRRASEPEGGQLGGGVHQLELSGRPKLSPVVACSNSSNRTDSGGGGGGGAGGGDDEPKREKRVKLNSLKADQRFPFWRHTYLHFHRSWLSIVRDPMLCSMQLALHIIVPLMVSVVYGTNVGKPNACPRAGPVDIMAYALEPTDYALQLQEDLRTTLENIGYIFFKLYGIIFAAMTVTVLTFPLDMHVLVKEFRNGWYGLSSYFLGRTLADIPFQLTLPLLAMSLSYYATGQPYSYMQWRFFSITAILILSSLIAQSQGLLFGAILMDRMKAAVFVAPAATTPIILFAGFLVRTQSIPHYLRPLSNLSYLRYAIEACLISRYGFNQCECDPAVFNQTVPELPPIARSMLDYWLGSFKPIPNDTTTGHETNSTLLETTTLASEATTGNSPDLFTKLIDSLARANSFGRNITSCEQVVPYPMIDYDLKDSQLFNCFGILLFMLVFTRLLTFFIVCFKVKRKV